MNYTIHIILGNNASAEDKWQKAFQNYLAYALSEKHNISISWKTPDDLQDNLVDETIPCFILGVYSTQHLQDQQWLGQLSQLYNSTDSHPNIFFYKILRDVLNVNSVPAQSEAARKIAFYVHDTKSGELISEDVLLSDKINQFLFKTFELAREIAFQAKQFTENKQSEQTSVPDNSNASKIVFLSQVSPQSSPLREKLKQELISQRFRVIPSVNYSIHPPSELKDIIYKDLKQATLIIQLFGEEIDHRQDGANSTIEAIQNEVAVKYFLEKQEDAENFVKRLIWIADNEKLKNEQYKRYITNLKVEEELQVGGDIYQCTVEELKDIVLEKLKGIIGKKKVNLSREPIPQQVYLIPDVDTDDDMYHFKSVLEERGFSVVYLDKPANQQEAKAQHEAFLFQSEGVVMIHNEHNIRWVRAKVNDIFKIKSKGRKDDFRFKIVLSRTIDQLPGEAIYRDVTVVHPEQEAGLEFLGGQVLENAE